ncbi:hypothetical protein OB920_02250 [Halobacteria archaeon HArc-gm2]|nr:hypothetical protein [Halobacteria archaeon HArc-gm2]
MVRESNTYAYMFIRGGPDANDWGDGIDGPSGVEIDGRDILVTIRDQLGPTSEPDWDLAPSVERTCSGTARRLVVPGRDVTVTDVELGTQYPINSPTELPTGEFRLTSRGSRGITEQNRPATVHVRFDGPASVKPNNGSAVLSFWERTQVTVGHETSGSSFPAQMTVEPTVRGVASAVSHLSAAHHTTGPARSHPGFRDHPPLVRIGEETEIPSAVREDTPDAGLAVHVPESLDALFVAAPLAYYLGAHVFVDDARDAPRLTSPEADVDYQFDPLPAFQHQCAQLLRRVFFLDCQVRRVASCRDRALRRLQSQFGLDPAAVQSGRPAERLAHYLDVPPRELDPELPDWHLTTYVSPEPHHARSLPYLLDRLSLVYLPQASTLERSDLLQSTLNDAYPVRGAATPPDVVQPTLQAGHVHAWLASGTPIDAFKTSTRAFENQFQYQDRTNDRLRVSVVLNDDRMADEHGTVSDIYRDRAANLPIDVTVRERLPRGDLADVFESANDFVHYIGHCDDEGLRCPDGNLDVADLSTSRTQMFFLNACGSYEQGLELVEQGSVTGAVTFRTVLDGQAARVGTAFARLLVHGFSFERALSLARRRILMGKDYAVVGDGTYALLPSPKQPAVVWIREASDDEFVVRCEVVNARSNGARYRLPFGETPVLNGSTTEFRLSREELATALTETSVPVVYDDDVHWSGELVDRL